MARQPKVGPPWIGKGSASTLIEEVHKYVEAYVAEHQEALNSDWFHTWYTWYHDHGINKPKLPFQVLAYAITDNHESSLMDVIDRLRAMIPELNEHMDLINLADNGNVRYTIAPYKYTIPKRTVPHAPSKPTPGTVTATSSASTEATGTNRYTALDIKDDEHDTEENNTTLKMPSNFTTKLPAKLSKDTVGVSKVPSSVPHTSFKTPSRDLQSELDIEHEDQDKDNASQSSRKCVIPSIFQSASTDTAGLKMKAFGSSLRSTASSALRNFKYKNGDFKNDIEIKNMLKSSKFQNESAPSPQDDNSTINTLNTEDQDTAFKHLATEKHNVNTRINQLKQLLRQHDWDQLLAAPQEVIDTTARVKRDLQSFIAKEKTSFKSTVQTTSEEESLSFQAVLESTAAEKHKEFYHWLTLDMDNKFKELEQRKEDTIREINEHFDEKKKEFDEYVSSRSMPGGSFTPSTKTIFKEAAAKYNTTSHPDPVTSSSSATLKAPKPYGPRPATSHPGRNHDSAYGFYDRNLLKFVHEGQDYLLQEQDFLKNSPNLYPCETDDDALTLYTQLQKNASIYNILIAPIDTITIWDLDPDTVPPTCALDFKHPTCHQAYQRMATAIYVKINKAKLPNSYFKEILLNEATSQDGFRVLYNMLNTCHPALIERPNMQKPDITVTTNLFAFIRQYLNFLEFERITGRNYTHEEQLNFVKEALEIDGRYPKALSNIDTHIVMHEKMQKIYATVPFPPSLMLKQLPYTVMKSYTTEERESLFGDDATAQVTDTGTARINRLNANSYQPRSFPMDTSIMRARVEKNCACCTTFGHNVFDNGCDFAAQFINTQKFLNKNSDMANKILRQYAIHQKDRRKVLQRKQTNTFQKRFYDLAKKNGVQLGAKVKALVDRIEIPLSPQSFSSQRYDEEEIDLEMEQYDEFHDSQADEEE